MLKYLTNAISRAIGFSKTESRGTLILILIIFLSLVASQARINYLKSTASIGVDSSTYYWANMVQSSFELKDQVGQEFDKRTNYSYEENGPTKYPPKKSAVGTDDEPNEPIVIGDLNTATALELQKVRGIGAAYSERIVKYRNLLGGYADISQLSEVYGLKEETIKELFKHFAIKTNVERLDFNTDSVKVLASHPYISYDLAWVIINYRREHGDIKSLSDLKKIKAVDEHTFLRLKPYLE